MPRSRQTALVTKEEPISQAALLAAIFFLRPVMFIIQQLQIHRVALVKEKVSPVCRSIKVGAKALQQMVAAEVTTIIMEAPVAPILLPEARVVVIPVLQVAHHLNRE